MTARNPAVQPTRITQKKIVINAVDLVGGTGKGTDPLGKEVDFRLDRRPKGTPAPATGETWQVSRSGYEWVLTSMLSVPQTPVITGSRTGADPLALSLLDALSQLGHVVDGTTT